MSIIPGAEPFYFPGGEVGCLLIHGFTSTPQEVREMGHYLAHRGHTVCGVRLQGHGTQPRDLARTRWGDWMHSVMDGYQLMTGECRQIVPMGLSMGGALALLFGSRHEVAGVVAMSTPIEFPPLRRFRRLRLLGPLLGPLSLILPFVPKPPRVGYHDPEAARTKIAYPTYPTRSLLELRRLLRRVYATLPQLRVPVLLMHSRADLGVSPSNAITIYERLTTAERELIWLENSGHSMTVDLAKEQVFSQAADFAARVTKNTAQSAA